MLLETKRSEKTIERLTAYYSVLSRLAGKRDYVSSELLSEVTLVSPALVRRDISSLTDVGQRGRGYPVDHLRDEIARVLNLDRRHPVVLVGAGNLGTALLGYRGFAEQGFEVVAVFDKDRRKVGHRIGQLVIEDAAALMERVPYLGARIAVLAVPADAAQEVADLLVEAGVRCILNFAPVFLDVPEGVRVKHVDLARQLQLLSYYLT